MDVVIGNERVRQTRLWKPDNNTWQAGDFALQLVDLDKQGRRQDAGVRFGVVREDGAVSILAANEHGRHGLTFRDGHWANDNALLSGLPLASGAFATSAGGRDRGVRLRDLDRDGVCELLLSNDTHQEIFAFDATRHAWQAFSIKLPVLTSIVDAAGRDAGLRFVDVDEDSYDDVVFSNDSRYSVQLFGTGTTGWRHVVSGNRGAGADVPMIARGGANNGAWFANHHMWVVNETTDKLKDHVDRRPFAEWLKDVEPEAKPPAASLRSIRVHPGFIVELVAAEPLVVDPVALDWGPDGRMYVAEMVDYPTGLEENGKPAGHIKCLVDSDGDGRYDQATVFLDGVSFPNGVKVWRKGLLVTAAPDIIYAEDTDSDGRADVREVLFHGFGEGNQQHRVNGLTFGLDNWLYCANGDSGGQIESTKTGEKMALSFRDFRIEPDKGALELVLGQSQFTRVRDDWGNWFGSSNSDPMYQFVLDDRYLRRNRHVAAPNGRVDVSIAPARRRCSPSAARCRGSTISTP